VSFLVEEVLEAEVRLVHVMACVCGGLFVGTRGGMGGAVESLEASKEAGGADGKGGVVGELAVGEAAEGVEDGERVWRNGGHDGELGPRVAGSATGAVRSAAVSVADQSG
jgi:hypothetical protein